MERWLCHPGAPQGIGAEMGSGAPFQLPLSEATCRERETSHVTDNHSDLRNDTFHTFCSSHTLLFCPLPGAAGKQQTTPTKGRWMLSPVTSEGGEGHSRNSKGNSRVPGCSGCRLGTGTGSGKDGSCRGKPFPCIQDKKSEKAGRAKLLSQAEQIQTDP